MNHYSAVPEKFESLSGQHQNQFREIARRMVELAQSYAIPIIFAPPRSIGGELNGATGCILQLTSGYYLITAAHVLRAYQDRLKSGERLNWQVGALPPSDPLSRIAWGRDSRDNDTARDIVFLRISAEEAETACGNSSHVATAYRGWPPPMPRVGQPILLSGYPASSRHVDSEGWIGAGPYSAMFRVTTIGSDYLYCQIDHPELISFDGNPLPAPGSNVGGLSGGPVLAMDHDEMSYPLIGIVTEHSQAYDVLRIATFEDIEERDLSCG